MDRLSCPSPVPLQCRLEMGERTVLPGWWRASVGSKRPQRKTGPPPEPPGCETAGRRELLRYTRWCGCLVLACPGTACPASSLASSVAWGSGAMKPWSGLLPFHVYTESKHCTGWLGGWHGTVYTVAGIFQMRIRILPASPHPSCPGPHSRLPGICHWVPSLPSHSLLAHSSQSSFTIQI